MRLVLFNRQIPFSRTEPRPINLRKPVYILTTLDPSHQARVSLEVFPMFTCEVERSEGYLDRALMGFEREDDAITFANDALVHFSDVPLVATSIIDEERVLTASHLLRLPLVLVEKIEDGEVAGMFEGFL